MLLKLGFGGLGIRLLIGVGCAAVYSISSAEPPATSFTETNNTAPAQRVFGQKNTGTAFNQSKTLLGQQSGKPAFLSATQALVF